MKDYAQFFVAILTLYAILKLIDVGFTYGIDCLLRWMGLQRNTSVSLPVPKEGENIVISLTTVSKEKKPAQEPER